MSLEIAIQNLTAEIIALRQAFVAGTTITQVPQTTGQIVGGINAAAGQQFNQAQAKVQTQQTFTPPVAQVQTQQTFTPPVAQATFAPPPVATAPAVVAAPAPGACPIVDQKTLVEYVMDAYKTLGPQKGAAIQSVLNNCQVQAINECRPEHYAYIHQCVEQLKAS